MPDNSTDKDTESSATEPVAVPVIDSEELLAPAGELAISHAGEVYRLRRTRKGGLILTK